MIPRIAGFLIVFLSCGVSAFPESRLREPSEKDQPCLRGWVVDPQGQAAPGTRIEVSRPLERVVKTVYSDREGSFEACLPAGVYTVVARLRGFAPWRAEIDTSQSSDLTVELSVAGFADEVTVTATRNPDPSDSLAGTVGVVDRVELERRIPSNVSEALAGIGGVYLVESGPFRARPILRGLDSNRVLVLVDGQRLNNARTSTTNSGIEPSLVDLNEVERIEVSKGASSVLYGSDALAGVVNIISRRPESPADLGFRGFFQSEWHSVSDALRFHARASLLSPRWDLVVGGTTGRFENYATPGGRVPNSGADETNLTASLFVRPSSREVWRLDWTQRDGSDIGVPGLGREDPFFALFPFDDRTKVGASYTREGVGPGIERLQGNFYWQAQKRDFFNRVQSPGFSLSSSTVTDTRSVGADFQVTQQASATHRLTYGASFYRDRNEDSRAQILFPDTPMEILISDAPSVPDASLGSLSVFVQDQWAVAERLNLTAGLRGDVVRSAARATPRFAGPIPEARTDATVTGQIGAAFRVDRNWTLFGRVGRAFRTPNLFEKFFFGRGSVGGFVVPNPDLRPEIAFDKETGVRFQSRSVRASVAWFHNRISDLIATVPATFMGEPTFGGQPVSTNSNINRARIQGVEASFRLSWSGWGWWSLRSEPSWQRGVDLTTGDPLPLIAPFTALSGLEWSTRTGRVSLRVETRSALGGDRVPPGAEALSGFTVIALGGELKLFDDAGFFRPAAGLPNRLNWRIENLTDKRYRELFNSVSAPGLDLRLVLGWKLGR